MIHNIYGLSALTTTSAEYDDMKVESSMMKEIEYHTGRKSLLVMFNDGKVWEYAGVRVELWELLNQIIAANGVSGCNGVSLGRAFHYLIKIHPQKYPAQHRPELTTCDFSVVTTEELDGTLGENQ